MKKVNIHEAKTNLSAIIAGLKLGEVVTICNRNVPVAEIRGVTSEPPKKRTLGWAKGTGVIHPNCFDPMTEEELAKWDGPLFPPLPNNPA